MPAKKFLDLLESQGFLDPAIVSELRGQVEKASAKVTPEAVAKKLVDAGHLTKFQATKLVGEAKAAIKSSSKRGKKSKDDDDLTLVDDPSASQKKPSSGKPQKQRGAKKPAARSKPASPSKPSGLEPIDGGLEPIDSGGLEPIDAGGLEPMDAGGLEPIGGGLEPLGGPGGLDGLTDDPNMGQAAPGGTLGAAPKKKGLFGGRKSKAPGGYSKPAPPPENIWDTKLIVVGTAALLLLFVAGGFLFYSLTRGTAQELFNLAEVDYSSESYSQAIEKYDQFLRKYKTDENASLAKVRVGMARIWQNAGDPQQALEMAGKVLPTIEPEEAFENAREELATVLPEIARKFSERASQSTNTTSMAENLLKAEEAMKLVDNASYVPTSLRTQVQGTINQVLETMNQVSHVIDRDNDLVLAIQEIETASAKGDMKKVYQVRDDLLDKYPGLEANDELQQQLRQVSARERTLVKLEKPTHETATSEQEGVGNLVVMATNSGDLVAGVDQEVVLIRVAGAVFCLNVKDGALLWRRLVGDGGSDPVRATVEVDANVILNDARTHELLCLKPRTGELVWRTAIGEPFLGPTVTQDEEILVVTNSGALIKVDAETGESVAQASTPLPATLAPAVKTRRPQVYHLAAHTNLYVHAEADTDIDGVVHKSLECREVFYLGHKAGSVVSSPVVLLGHIFIAVNSGPQVCDLHILRIDKEGLNIRSAQDPMRLQGRVVVEPVIANRRLVVTTDLGSIYVLDVDPTAEGDPVTDAVEKLVVDRTDPLISYASVDRASLWIGDNRLSRYDIQVAKSELSRRWVKLPGDVFRAPIQHVGNAVIHTRTPKGGAGVLVSAVNGDSGEPIWQTTIGADAGAAFFTPGGELRAVSSSGQLYGVASGEARMAKMIADASGDGLGGAYLHAVKVGDQKLAVCSLSDRSRYVLVDTASGDQIAQQRMAVSSSPTAEPVFASGGLAVGLASGEVVLVNPEDGTLRSDPFFPAVAAGESVRWFAAAPAGVDDQEIVITDNRRNVFRLEMYGDEFKYLRALSHSVLENDIVSRPAALEDVVFVAVRSIREAPKSTARGRGTKTTKTKKVQEIVGDLILPLSRVGLRPGEPMPLKGRVVQGPYRVGDHVFLISDQEGLVCLEAVSHDEDVLGPAPEEEGEAEKKANAVATSGETVSGPPAEKAAAEKGAAEKGAAESDDSAEPGLVVVGTRKSYIKWRQPVNGLRMVGAPTIDGETLMFAFYNGEVWRLDPATGEVSTRFALREPIAVAPTRANDQFVFPDLNGGLRLMQESEIDQSP